MAVTRNDVARQAGVSPAVVSYVMNDGPRPVSAATRARVLEAVRILGYRPDGLARSLRLGKTKLLGLLVPDATNPFFAGLARQIEDAAYERAYGVLVCNSADDPERERGYVASLAERRVDGLIVVASTMSQDLRALTDLSIPVVALDRTPAATSVSTISVDNEQGAFDGTRHLVEHGYSAVGFVAGPESNVSDARRDGWRKALVQSGLEPGAVINAQFSYEGGRAAALSLFSERKLRAVLVSSDIQALGVLRGLNEIGLACPIDVAIVSIDGTTAGSYAVPPLTSVEQPIAEMSVLAVEHLTAFSRDESHRVLQTRLVTRQSCGCAV